MHVEVETRRLAASTGNSQAWLTALCLCAALAFVAWAAESSILLPASFADRYALMKSEASGWATARFPASVLPTFRNFAALALSPLLYLGFAAVLAAERLAPADRDQRPFCRGVVHDGIAWYFINTPLRAFVFVGAVGLFYFVFDNFAPFLRISPELTSAVPMWILAVAAVVVADLMKWLQHYVHHKVALLWHFHSVHHSQRELNLFTQARFHALEMATLAPIMYLPLYMLNLDFTLAVWILLITEWHGRVTHANLRTNFGPLRYVFVTPQSHRIHHSRDSRHHDQNFGTLFSFWDRLFGTQWPDHEEYPATGIADESFPLEKSVSPSSVLANYFAQLVYPFQRIVRSRRDSDGGS
ncbi:MAG: sterol desaturase family protein [Pirellulales bacterium]